jgi:C4-dicarboxylate-specific signal transduction histidine kinase
VVIRLAHRRGFLLTLAAWGLSSALVWSGATYQAHRIERDAEAAVLARAEVAAEAIEQSLRRTLEAVEGLHDLAQVRQNLIEAGSLGGAEAIERQLASFARRARFGVLQIAVIDADGSVA